MVSLPKVVDVAVRRSRPPSITPTSVIDLRDRSNCLRIARVKPGQKIRVFVRSEDGAKAQPIVASGTLSNDGTSFFVVVTRADGARQTHDFYYRDLLKTLLSDID